MQRRPEPELMDEDAQARAYAEADFSEPHERFVQLFEQMFGQSVPAGTVLDLGCGPADINIRFAQRYSGVQMLGVDGAEAMLRYGRDAVERAGLASRVRLVHGYLPGYLLPARTFDAVISNSLLHHMVEPIALWDAVAAAAKPGAPVFVMDLARPAAEDAARVLAAQYTAGAPEILQRDFYNSLLAAYRPEEVAAQLASAGLRRLHVSMISDRHWVAAGHA